MEIDILTTVFQIAILHTLLGFWIGMGLLFAMISWHKNLTESYSWRLLSSIYLVFLGPLTLRNLKEIIK
jgi:hypothetical protein